LRCGVDDAICPIVLSPFEEGTIRFLGDLLLSFIAKCFSGERGVLYCECKYEEEELSVLILPY